jgi:hypothetical protein
MKQIGPRGWHPGQIEKRFANTAPSSYSAENRTVDAVVSMGSPVRRFYGIEKLRIAPDAINVDRLIGSGIPVLDSHMQASISSALGKLTRVWFPNDGTLMGKLAFHATTEGRKAEGMVRRGEIAGISAGYRVEEWEATDANGDIVDPDSARWDDDLTFEAVKWELLECSLCSVPADAGATVRSLGSGNNEIDNIRARMLARQAMYDRQKAIMQ